MKLKKCNQYFSLIFTEISSPSIKGVKTNNRIFMRNIILTNKFCAVSFCAETQQVNTTMNKITIVILVINLSHLFPIYHLNMTPKIENMIELRMKNNK